MKKLSLTLLAILLTMAATAQDYRVVITKTDGTTEELLTSQIRDITFAAVSDDTPQLPDQYADQLVVKEVYNGGILKDDGKSFHYDKCIVLYNNCPRRVVVSNLCIGMASPYNSQSNNNWYTASGKLAYEDGGYIPAIDGIWYFPKTLVVEPFAQVVVNVHGAIDNTLTYPASINYAREDYYCMYDPEAGYANTSYYPAPSEVIPASHYLKAVRIGQSNAWPFSNSSPAVILFQTKGVTPSEFANDADNIVYQPGMAQTPVYANFRVPTDWIIDAVEIYSMAHKDKNSKRLTAAIDAGYVYLTNQLGHSVYRNVDKELTEERAENAGKLVYGYSLGVDGSTDPSGIDAEASMRQGAHIVYQKNYNATTDFHERKTCSLK